MDYGDDLDDAWAGGDLDALERQALDNYAATQRGRDPSARPESLPAAHAARGHTRPAVQRRPEQDPRHDARDEQIRELQALLQRAHGECSILKSNKTRVEAAHAEERRRHEDARRSEAAAYERRLQESEREKEGLRTSLQFEQQDRRNTAIAQARPPAAQSPARRFNASNPNGFPEPGGHEAGAQARPTTPRKARKRAKTAHHADELEFDDEDDVDMRDITTPRRDRSRLPSAPQTPIPVQVSQNAEFDSGMDASPAPAAQPPVSLGTGKLEEPPFDRAAYAKTVLELRNEDARAYLHDLLFQTPVEGSQVMTALYDYAQPTTSDYLSAVFAMFANQVHCADLEPRWLDLLLPLLERAIDKLPRVTYKALHSSSASAIPAVAVTLQQIVISEPREGQIGTVDQRQALRAFERLCELCIEDEPSMDLMGSHFTQAFLFEVLTQERLMSLRTRVMCCIAIVAGKKEILLDRFPHLPGWIAASLATPTFVARTSVALAAESKLPKPCPADAYVPRPRAPARRARGLQVVKQELVTLPAPRLPDVGAPLADEVARYRLMCTTLQCLHRLAHVSAAAHEHVFNDRACYSFLVASILDEVALWQRTSTRFSIVGRFAALRGKKHKPQPLHYLELAVKLYAFLANTEDGAVWQKHWNPSAAAPAAPGDARPAVANANTTAAVRAQSLLTRRQTSLDSAASRTSTVAGAHGIAFDRHASHDARSFANGGSTTTKASPQPGPLTPPLTPAECRAAHIVAFTKLSFMFGPTEPDDADGAVNSESDGASDADDDLMPDARPDRNRSRDGVEDADESDEDAPTATRRRGRYLRDLMRSINGKLPRYSLPSGIHAAGGVGGYNGGAGGGGGNGGGRSRHLGPRTSDLLAEDVLELCREMLELSVSPAEADSIYELVAELAPGPGPAPATTAAIDDGQ